MQILGIGPINTTHAFIKQPQGFTLLEVMVALVILALGLTALVMSTINIVDQQDYLARKSIATWVARDVMSQLRLGLVLPSTVKRSASGSEQQLQQQWRWQLTLQATPDKNTAKVTVIVGDSQQSQLIEMIGYVRERP